MLSPGQHYRKVPKDPRRNLEYRRDLLRRAARDPRGQDALREACRSDCLFWINSFVFQVNPRKKGGGEVGPFVTWPVQDKLILWILDHVERDRDALIEKSREVGASWCNLLVKDWLSLFHRWQKFLCLSHTEDAVDKAGDMDSLFEKVAFIHSMLPGWMKEGVKRRRLGFTFPSKSSITGQASTERSGVGGRATAVFLDEFAKQRDDWHILGQTADTGPRIFNSTHYGTGTAFYDLCTRADRGEIDRFILHWSHHPDKGKGLYRWDQKEKRVQVLDQAYTFPTDYHFVMDGSPHGGPFPGLRSPWYDAECVRRKDSRNIAMHLDIDPKGATSQAYEPAIIRELIEEYACAPGWRGDLRYDRETADPLDLAQAPGGPLELWVRPLHDGSMPPARYVVGGDLSLGTGATPSCLSVFNADRGEKVGQYTNSKVDPKECARVAVALCRLFKTQDGGPAKLIWEMQGPGLLFGQQILDLGFRHIYYRTTEQPHTLGVKVSDRPGWVPTPDSKRLLHEEYRSALYSRSFINRSEAALEECLEFCYTERGDTIEHGQLNTDDPTSARVNHGDHVVADALCWKEGKGLRVRAKRAEDETPLPGTLAWRRMLAAHEARQKRPW